MLGKVIAHGPDREAARQALVQALDDTAILGLTTNAGFLRALLASEEFRDATIDTAWLDRHDVPAPDPGPARALAAWAVFRSEQETAGPFRSDGFRIASAAAPVVVELDEPVTLAVPPERDPAAVVRHDQVEVVQHGQRFVFERPDVMVRHAAVAGDGTLLSPMPGTVLDVRVAVGDDVEEGQVLGVIEAMKMELSLKAPFAGTVTTVGGEAGRQVALGDTLFVVETGHAVKLPDRVTIYEVGPRDGLQNESDDGADRRQGRVRAPAAGRGAAGRRGDVVRPPDVGAPARRRRRPDGASWASRAATARCWCPTSAGSTGPSSSASGTSRSSARRPRPSRRRTSTAAWTSSSRCSSRRCAGLATPGSTSAPTSACASATPGRATSRSTRSSASASGCSTSAPASSASATPSAWAPRAR